MRVSKFYNFLLNKNIKPILIPLIIFCAINFLIFFAALLEARNFRFEYFFFSICVNAYFLYCNRLNSTFVEKFFSFYIWLGFWFLFTINLVFFDNFYLMGTGNFNFDNYNNLKNALNLISCVSLSLIPLSYISQKFITKN